MSSYVIRKKDSILTTLGPSSIVSFNDNLEEAPINSLVANIEPVQDLHGYDNPWPAGGGKNKFDYDTTYAAFKQSDGTFRGAANQVGSVSYRIPSGLVGSQLTFSAFLDLTNSGELTRAICLANVSGSWVYGNNIVNGANGYSSVTFTPTSTDDYVALEYGSNGGDPYTFSEIQLEVGALRTSFAPYSNICPITGWTGAKVTRTGKNLLSYTPSKLSGSVSVLPLDKTMATMLKAGQTYKLSFEMQNATMWRIGALVFDYDGDRIFENTTFLGQNSILQPNVSGRYYVWGSNYSFTEDSITPKTDCFIMLFWLLGDTTDVTTMVNAQLELGSTATAYEPYVDETYDITFPSSAGTVYGGTLTIDADGGGVLTVDRAMVIVSQETGVLNNNGQSANTTRGFFTPNTAKLPGLSGFTSDKFHISSDTDFVGKINGRSANGSVEFYIPATVQDTAAAVRAWFADNPTQLCYPLATPVTYEFTTEQISLLTGVNTLQANTGNITVKYNKKLSTPTPGNLRNIVHLTNEQFDSLQENGSITSNNQTLTYNNYDLYITPNKEVNTTYSLTQDTEDGHKLIFKDSNDRITNITIPDNDTTYQSKNASNGGIDVSLVTTGEKYIWNSKTSNTGTVTSITPGNGLISGTSGSAQTAITTSGTISIGEGKVTNAMLAGSIANGKLANSSIKIGSKTINLGDTVSLSDIGVSYPVTGVKGNAENTYRTGQVNLTAANIGAYSTTEIDNKLKKYLSYSHYGNQNNNNNGKYYKININSTVAWMLNFTVKLYHSYRAYDLQISGYNYGSSYWYKPTAIILGASTTDAINVIFGYDSEYHLWIAIPALQYTGIDVLNATNGHVQITDIENLFSIELVDGEPTTKQVTITAYRPWYRNEIIPIEYGGTGVTSAADAWTALGGGASGKHADSYFVKAITSTDNAIVRFDGTSGQIQNSGVTIDDNNNITVPGALRITSTAGSKYILMGNQNSGGTNKPAVIWSSNGNLFFGIGDSWSSATGGTVTTNVYFSPDGKVNIGSGTSNLSQLLNVSGGSILVTKAGECGIEIDNTQETNSNKGAFIVGSSGNLGIYSRKHNKWVVYSDASGNVELNGNATTATTATTAATASQLKGYPESSPALTTAPATGSIRYSYNVNHTTTGLFDNTNNANSILTLNKHEGNYNSQLGFSSNGKLYYRSFNGNALDTTTTWKQIAFTDSDITGSAGSVALSGVSGADDLKAIEALTGTSGLLKKTAANTWSLDTTSYAPIASPTFTGTPKSITPSSSSDSKMIATKEYVDNAFAANDAMIFKGTIGSSGATVTALPATHNVGWTYRVITADTYAGIKCEIGDLIICVTDGTADNNAHWTVAQTNIDGAVIGPASSTENNLVLFGGTNGKSIKDSGVTLNTSSGSTTKWLTEKGTWTTPTAANVGAASSNHTHYKLTTIGDNRNENTTPNAYSSSLIFQGLKYNSKIGAPYIDTYSYIVGLRGWGDSSGGDSHELAFNTNGIYRRQGATTEWGNWFHLLDSNNYTNYAIAKTAGVTAVTWDSTNKKLTRTINGATADVVTFAAGSNISLTAESGKLTIANTYTAPVSSVAGKTGAVTLAKGDVGLGNVDNTADANKTVKYANMLTGFSSRADTMGWGNQTGSVITYLSSSSGGAWGFRDNNPTSGQLSMTIDGTIYIKEGAVNIGDAVKSFSVSGKTVTYTTLWGNTGTFTTQDTDTDTKNTAGSTNSTSKLYLIGATTQAANPTTNSYQYTYTNNGLLSALKLGLNLNGTEKAHLEWNDTDQSIDFVFA